MGGTLKRSKRVTLVDKDYMILDLEYNRSHVILHLPFIKLNKTSYLALMEVVPEIWTFLHTMGYQVVHAAIPSDNKAINKLLLRIGAVKVSKVDGHNVYEYRGKL